MRLPRLVALVVLLVAVLLPLAPPGPAAASSCSFVLGFKALDDLIPASVGTCLVDEHHNPQNGDGLQETTGGLLVWRKLDNWTAFTDGYHTWLNGPAGLQERLNTERFTWEGDYQTFRNPTPTPTVTPAPGVPAGATARCVDGTYSFSQHREGTCSYHQGVAEWLVNLPP